ncbi:MAG: S9 family peptidase [Candidatus Zixiibacteriota bacterium]|nr:MAG: S9 family peptidase [candidate division Zixibacteria bacterium]
MGKTTILFIAIIILAAGTLLNADDRYIPDIQTFMLIGDCSAGHVSPVTGELFFKTSISGEPQLYRINQHGWPYRLTYFPDGIGNYVMSDDGSKIIVLAAPGGNERRQMYLLDPESGRIKALTNLPDVRFGSVIWAPDNKTIYYYSTEMNLKDFNIYSMNVETGQSKLVREMEGINDVLDVTKDGRYLLIQTWPKNVDNDLIIMDLSSGNSRYVLNPDGDYNFFDGRFTPDGKYIWMTSNFNKKELIKPARYDIEKDKLEFFDMESPWEVAGDDMALSENGNYIAWIANEDGYGVLHIAETSIMKELPAPSLSGIVDQPVFASDNRLIITFSSPTKTYDVWVWDWSKRELEQKTFSSYAGINPDIFIEPELIRYKTFDGREIPAFLFLPPGYKGDRIPFIIHAHGGPEGQYRPKFYRNFQYFLLNGYGMLAPNVRGSEGYGREYMTLDNHRKRLDSIKDYKAGADYLIEKGYSEKGKLAIKGGSYGGYATLAAISEYPDYWGAAASQVGISNFKTFLLNTADYRRYIREAEYGPLSDSVWLESISPTTKADRIKSPLLLIHGANDPRVPISEARQIFNAVKDNGGVADTLFFTNEGHGTANKENTIAEYTKMVEFFDKYLK